MPLELKKGEKASVTHDDELTYSVETELIIDAPAKLVWEVLTDFEKLAEWSPGMVKYEGEFKLNAVARMTFMIGVDDYAQTLDHILCYFEDGFLFGWSTKLPHMDVRDDHMYTVEVLGENQSKIVQTDQFQGHSANYLGGMLANGAMHQYVDFNRALKKRVEEILAKGDEKKEAE